MRIGSALAAALLLAAPALAQHGAPGGQWLTWGGDAGHTRYAPLDQITAENVDQLQIAWRWASPVPDGRYVSNYKSTPLMHAGVLYVPSGNHGAAAIDAGTGATLWTFEPDPVDIGGRSPAMSSRALALWTDGTETRLFHNSLDGRLIAIDAATGQVAEGFGENGWVDLRAGVTEGREVTDVGSVSPAVVVGDVVVVSVTPGGARNMESAPGAVRGYDVRTGARLWTFNTIPQAGEPGHETWEGDSAAYTGNAGAWTMMTADPAIGYVYVPVESPTHDFYGGHHMGDNLYAESLLCLDGATGERIWHFQISHHPIWDYDLPAAPILHDVIIDGEVIPAVTQLTKQNMSFVFNRLTGEPIWPIEERAVPQTSLEGERTSPTQPFVTRPAPYSPQGYHEDLLIDFTPELRAEALAIAENHVRGPMYTPPSEVTDGGTQGTWMYPGHGGGANWNAAAFDPETGMMYVPIRHRVNNVGMRRGDPEVTDVDWVRGASATIEGPRGLPILKPPYSEMVATDMNVGEHLWRVPIGGAPDFVREHPDLQGLGLDFDAMGGYDVRPSPLLTETLLFLSEAGSLIQPLGGPTFRAYDKATGEVVWEFELPAKGTGAPMTYMHEGRQYVVIGVSDDGRPPELVALGLGGGGEAPSAVAAAPAAVLEASTTATPAAAPAITLNTEEDAAGAALFAAQCALCHGHDGAGINGSSAPPLQGLADLGYIREVVRRGGAEMPPMGTMLTEEQIETVSRYVAAGLGE